MKRTKGIYLALLAVLLSPMAANADALTMDAGRHFSPNYDDGGMGNGRGIGILANESFDMTALAIDLNVDEWELAVDYQFTIYSSNDGLSAASLLDAVSFNLGFGAGYQDQAFAFSFLAGNYYILNFSRVDELHLGGLGTKYSWEDDGVFTPYDYGLVTIIEGFEGSFPNNYNPLIPHMRITYNSATAVPEPGTLALLALGLTGIGMSRRRKR